MLVSYHTHSKWSDGQTDIIELVKKASELQLDEIGISDHYLLTAEKLRFDWTMDMDLLDQYVSNVQTASGSAYGETIVRLGLEADYVPGMEENLKAVLDSHPFDFIIGSIHLVGGFPIDYHSSDWDPLDQPHRDDIIREYWKCVRRMAESGLFDFAAHLDLFKKFDIKPSTDMEIHIDAALDAIARADMAVELNTAGWYMPCEEAYPAPSIIGKCVDRGIPFLVNSDAHTPSNLIRGYDKALQLLREFGVKELVRYAGRQKFTYPIYSLDEPAFEIAYKQSEYTVL